MYIGNEIFRLYDTAKTKFPDFDTWVAEAVREEFGKDLVSPLMTAKICKITRLPWTDPDTFEAVALILNGREVIPDVSLDISVKEIAFAVDCLQKEFPEDTFEEKVLLYFAAEADEEGITTLPPQLKEAQVLIKPIFLTPEQQSIQDGYLDEVKVYCDFMKNITSEIN